jgi:hypothetical protein
MSNDPLRIHVDKLGELLRGFGLDPVDLADIRAVHILPEGITVIRMRRDERGRRVVVDDDVALETVTIRLDATR